MSKNPEKTKQIKEKAQRKIEARFEQGLILALAELTNPLFTSEIFHQKVVPIGFQALQ
ncbi:MAG: hypothetical protein IPK77_05040 [Cellvibrio sp.]|nr:hypothetical protein [Cellvibrio sp.]